MMSIEIEEIQNRRQNVHKTLVEELRLNYRYYKDYQEVEFNADDNYSKFLLFSFYRAIESLLLILVDEREKFSKNRNFFEEIFRNTKSHFLSGQQLSLILDDVEESKITYQDIFEFILSEQDIHNVFPIHIVNEVKHSTQRKDTPVHNGTLIQDHIDCLNNRNNLMHSNVKIIHLTFDYIKKAVVVYSYLYLLFDQLLKK